MVTTPTTEKAAPAAAERATATPPRIARAPRARVAIDITKPLAEQPAYLRLPEAAALLRKSVRTIALWEQRGLIKVLRIAGGAPLIERAEIERLQREAAGEAA